jgi:hypothetical protein
VTDVTPPKVPEPPYTIDQNSDGSVVVKLRRPVRFNGEDYTRLTIPALTGRHMRACPYSLGERPVLGELVTFAQAVIEPVGVVDVLPAAIARDLGVEVMMSVGKSLGIGEAR